MSRRLLLPFLLLVLLPTGCATPTLVVAQQGGRLYPEEELDVEAEEEELPPMWVLGNHPVAMISAAGHAGNYRYKTTGTGANTNSTADARLYRLVWAGPFGVDLDFLDSDAGLGVSGQTNAEAFDGFVYANRPLWPNNRLRFMSRPGVYFDKINLKKSGATDVEPWSWGFRFELEAEVDIVKSRQFVLSAFGNGRIGGGWGEAKVGGVNVGSSSWDWGYEAGVRAQYARFFLAASWIDRTTNVEGSALFSSAEYRFEGAGLTLGVRW